MKQEMIAGLVLAVIGIVLAVFPNQLWAITEKWKSGGAKESTAGYRTVVRIVGAVSILTGILLMSGVIR